MSTFSALNAATTALWAQRRALDVTGQNIANVNTEGYSRQRADLQAIGGSPIPAFYSTSPGIGAGVNAEGVLRIRDAFLEGRGHTEHANSARLVAEADAYTQVESSFREPGDTGIQSLMGEMWAAWGDVDNGPHELASRGQVMESLKTLDRWRAVQLRLDGHAVGPDPGQPRRPGLRREQGRGGGREAQHGDPAGHPVGTPGQRPHRPARPARS